MPRLLLPSAALFWGLQFAFLNPALALLLVELYGASAGEVGAVLAAYNASGFVASLLVPAWADRRGDYLRPLLVCGALTLVLAGALALVTSLPAAVVALVVVGGPAGVGNSLLFAHVRASGAAPERVVRLRAVVSVAWVAGPPLATLVLGSFGERALLWTLGVIALLNVLTTLGLPRDRPAAATGRPGRAAGEGNWSRSGVVLLVLAFVALQATNAAAVSVMGLFVTQRLGLDVLWAGVALGVTAALEIPALLLVGRLTGRVSPGVLVVAGCACGLAYYVGLAFLGAGAVVGLLALQVLNAAFFAVVAGVGLTLFQDVISRPGLATGVYTNTRRVGAIVAGPLLALGAATSWGYSLVLLACGALCVVAAGAVLLGRRVPVGPPTPAGSPAPQP